MSFRMELAKRMGRPPRFATAQEMWDTFLQYVEFVDKHPIELPTYVSKKDRIKGSEQEGKGGKVARPLTLDGFMAFCGMGQPWKEFARYQCERGADFSAAISRIRSYVRSDQIEGGMAGIYNSNLTARLNGLIDKTESRNENTQEIIIKTDAETATLVKGVIDGD